MSRTALYFTPLQFTVDGVYCTVCLAKSYYRGLRLEHFTSCAWFRSLTLPTAKAAGRCRIAKERA